jgi:hypothetical protein
MNPFIAHYQRTQKQRKSPARKFNGTRDIYGQIPEEENQQDRQSTYIDYLAKREIFNGLGKK